MKTLFLFVVIFMVVTLTANATDIELSWDPVQHPSVAGYNVHYSDSNPDDLNTIIDNGTSTSIELTNLPGEVYYIAASAYTNEGLQSGLSKIVCNHWMPERTYPAENATNIPTDVQFEWTQPQIPDDYTYTVLFGPAGGTMVEYQAIPLLNHLRTPNGPALPTTLSLLIVSLIIIVNYRRTFSAFVACSVCAVVLTSCSGGGGSDSFDSSTTSEDGRSLASAQLLPNTTYNWKVLADNGDVLVESTTGTFTTGN